MWRKFVNLLTSFLCGYLFILWFPVNIPFNIADFMVEFVMNPIEFFAASVVFMIGFMINAHLIKEGAELTAFIFHQKKISLLECFLSSFVLVNFLVLFSVGFWQTMIFFCFSVIYGIISLDFKKLKFVED